MHILVIFAEISDVMEDVLLCNPCIGAKVGWVKMPTEVFVDSALHPYVNGKCLKVRKAEEGGTGGNLVANSEDFLKLGQGEFVISCLLDFGKVHLARTHSLGRVNEILVPEAGMGGE